MFEFIKNEQINLPWMCISKPNNKIVITTKKIGSGYFADVSVGIGLQPSELNPNPIIVNYKNGKKLTIDFRFENIIDNFDSKLILDDIIAKVIERDDTLLFEEFCEIFGISSISEIFSKEYFKNNEIYIITRNPIDRFYSGFFENINSIVNEHFGIENLKTAPQHIIDAILNDNINKVEYSYFSDPHLSLWNTFIFNLIVKYNLEKYTNVIDLSENKKLESLFGILDVHSNKSFLDGWITNSNNKKVINNSIEKIKFYLDLELENYNKLLNLNNSNL